MNDKPPIDWNALEQEMLRLAKHDLTLFAKSHGDETYYGFHLDCNAEYGEVLLCLNSVEALEHSAHNLSSAEIQNIKATHEHRVKRYQEMCKKLGDEYRAQKPDPADTPPDFSVEPESRLAELRWSPGDWKYQGFNSNAWDEGLWSEFSEEVCEATIDEEYDGDESPIVAKFMEVACRVVVQLARSEAFSALKRTPDFECRCADHGDTEEEAAARLGKVGAEFDAS